MTLYRIKVELCDCELCELIRSLLVPVEPCEHGNYARHIKPEPTYQEMQMNWTWCPGAGIGGDDET